MIQIRHRTYQTLHLINIDTGLEPVGNAMCVTKRARECSDLPNEGDIKKKNSDQILIFQIRNRQLSKVIQSINQIINNKNVLSIQTIQIAPFRTLMTALKDILLETNITFAF